MNFASRLSFALRSLVGPWAVLLVVPIQAANLMQRSVVKSSEAMWIIDWMGAPLIVIGPIAAGFAAEDVARSLVPRRQYNYVARRPRYQIVIRLWAWTAVPLMASHVVLLAVALVAAPRTPTGLLSARLLGQFVVQMLAIGWFAALGATVGRYLKPTMAGFAAVVLTVSVGFLLNGSTKSAPSFELLWTGGATYSRVGLQYSADYLVAQGGVFLVTALLMLTAPVVIDRGRVAPVLSNVAVVVLSVVVIAVGQVLGPDRRNERTLAGPDICYEWGPTICLYQAHDFERVAVRINELYDDVASTKYKFMVPERVEQVAGGYNPTDDGVATFFLTPDDLYGAWMPELVIPQLVEPDCLEATPEDSLPYKGIYRDIDLVAGTLAELGGYNGYELMDVNRDKLAPPRRIREILARWDECDQS